MANEQYGRILAAAEANTANCVSLLQDLVRVKSLSCEEGPVIERIVQAMRDAGWDEVRVDRLGNVIGRIGSGPRVLAFDAHIDTVDVTDESAFPYPPFAGEVHDGCVWGRGASDQKAGMAAIVEAGRVLQQIGVPADMTVYGVGTVMEEDCDGLCWNWLVEEEGLRPEAVVLTEPTDCQIYRGHRGRMEMEVEVRGRSAHGSMPHLGDNAIYKMARIVSEVETMGATFAEDPFLGKGTVTVSAFRSKSPSLCAVADGAVIHLDRRLTVGETLESSVAEVEALPSVQAADAKVRVLDYDVVSHTGQRYGMKKYYPTWLLDETHPLVQAGVTSFAALHGENPAVSRWTFSTNGVTICGVHGIPAIGFGPAHESHAHTPVDRCPVADLTKAMAFYAALVHTWPSVQR